MADIVPTEKRRLRACLMCGLVKAANQFRLAGCENCEEILQLQNSNKNIDECTSGTFDGLIAMMDPSSSWVARWQRADKYVKGMYAIRVAGRLPEDIQAELADRNITYRPRDGSEVVYGRD